MKSVSVLSLPEFGHSRDDDGQQPHTPHRVHLVVCFDSNSAAVQHTLYDMGVGVLAKAPLVEKINLYMVSDRPPHS